MNIQISLSHFENLIKIVSSMSLFQQIQKIFNANYLSNVLSHFSARSGMISIKKAKDKK